MRQVFLNLVNVQSAVSYSFPASTIMPRNTVIQGVRGEREGERTFDVTLNGTSGTRLDFAGVEITRRLWSAMTESVKSVAQVRGFMFTIWMTVDRILNRIMILTISPRFAESVT